MVAARMPCGGRRLSEPIVGMYNSITTDTTAHHHLQHTTLLTTHFSMQCTFLHSVHMCSSSTLRQYCTRCRMFRTLLSPPCACSTTRSDACKIGRRGPLVMRSVVGWLGGVCSRVVRSAFCPYAALRPRIAVDKHLLILAGRADPWESERASPRLEVSLVT